MTKRKDINLLIGATAIAWAYAFLDTAWYYFGDPIIPVIGKSFIAGILTMVLLYYSLKERQSKRRTKH